MNDLESSGHNKLHWVYNKLISELVCEFASSKNDISEWLLIFILKFLSENIKGLDHLGDLGVHAKIIFKWILDKEVVKREIPAPVGNRTANCPTSSRSPH
jgi:hypothetical protein